MIAYKIDVKVRAAKGENTLTFIVGSVGCIGQVIKDIDEQNVLSKLTEATITRLDSYKGIVDTPEPLPEPLQETTN